jgi:hypothetical protein
MGILSPFGDYLPFSGIKKQLFKPSKIFEII